VQYVPVCSTAGAAAAGSTAAAAVGQTSGACLTARQLLQLLLQAQQQQTAQKGRAAGDICRVLLGAADTHLLEATMHADG
jgi:TRAP-type mannitol/chloroaromatic compound transport system permease large subunit